MGTPAHTTNDVLACIAAANGVRDDEVAARTERTRAIGLFRYELIREAADSGLSSKARGRLEQAVGAGSSAPSSSIVTLDPRSTLLGPAGVTIWR